MHWGHIPLYFSVYVFPSNLVIFTEHEHLLVWQHVGLMWSYRQEIMQYLGFWTEYEYNHLAYRHHLLSCPLRHSQGHLPQTQTGRTSLPPKSWNPQLSIISLEEWKHGKLESWAFYSTLWKRGRERNSTIWQYSSLQ